MSSSPTEPYINSDKILELGKKLVEQLGLEMSTDTLSRWMAHYIAELLATVEGTCGDERITAEKRCFEAILALWEHRSEYPGNKKPFSDLAPVIRAVESLDPDDNTPRFFRSAFPDDDESKNIDPDAREWIKVASGLDYTAKLLIGDCLREAAGKAVDNCQRWAALAAAAGAEPGVPEVIVRFIVDDDAALQESDPNITQRRHIEGRLERLAAFAKFAARLESAYRAELATLAPTKDLQTK